MDFLDNRKNHLNAGIEKITKYLESKLTNDELESETEYTKHDLSNMQMTLYRVLEEKRFAKHLLNLVA